MDWKSAAKKAESLYQVPERWLHIHYYEALNILFRVENSLRVFVYVILKNNLYDEWFKAIIPGPEGSTGTIESIAKKRMSQAKTFGYLGYEVTCPIMHLSSGELINIIISEAYWKHFSPYFKASKEIITNKLEEIGAIRNSIAHFRPIKTDDVEVIKQNAKHALMAIEECLLAMTSTFNVVPTNTSENWYKNLSTLGNQSTKITIYQSKNLDWIRILLSFTSRILNMERFNDFISYQILNLLSPQVINKYLSISKYCTYLSETIPAVYMKDDWRPDFRKEVSLVFWRQSLVDNYKIIHKDLIDFLAKLTEEEELVGQDHLAKGEFVESVNTYASLTGEEEHKYWNISTWALRCPFEKNYPAEYWGDIAFYSRDFIAGSMQYPWMPSNISKPEPLF